MLYKSAWMTLRQCTRIKVRQLLSVSNLSTTPCLLLLFSFWDILRPLALTPLLLCQPLTPAPRSRCCSWDSGTECRRPVFTSYWHSSLFPASPSSQLLSVPEFTPFTLCHGHDGIRQDMKLYFPVNTQKRSSKRCSSYFFYILSILCSLSGTDS